MICPWFGDEPAWANRYQANIAALAEYGYDFLHERDLDDFRSRCQAVLDIDCPIQPGSAKIQDYRPALGLLYANEIEEGGYEFWGHTDYDCVYGRIDRFVTDQLLDSCDIQTDNGHDYLCGPWTLYRADVCDTLFTLNPEWRQILEDPITSGWVETSFTDIAKAHVTVDRQRFHRHTQPELLTTDGDGLLWDEEEISFFHFRYTKQWPTIPMVDA